MTGKGGRWFFFLAGLVLLTVLGQWPDGQLRIIGCQVGQGDATLVTLGFTQVLVDGGPPNGRVLTCLGRHMPFWDRQIEMVMQSHPEVDHFGGLVEVVKRYQVGTLVVPDVSGEGEEFNFWVNEVKKRQVKTIEARTGVTLTLGNEKWEVIWPDNPVNGQSLWFTKTPDEPKYSSINNEAIVATLVYKNVKMLFTGDIERGVEEKLVKRNNLPKVEILKIAHHGSKTSSQQAFLDKVKPKVALIHVGKNSYGHPHLEVMARLAALEVRVLRTDGKKDAILMVNERGEIRTK